MIEEGLIEEVKALLNQYELSLTAKQAIGYKEILPYLRGERSLAEAAETLKRATRHYAKRQMTWFRAKSYVRWVGAADLPDFFPEKE